MPKHGPNVNKLIAKKMTLIALPPRVGRFDLALDFLLDPKRVSKAMQEAEAWVVEAIKILRLAKAPNPYLLMSDEEIAAVLLQEIEARSKAADKARMLTEEQLARLPESVLDALDRIRAKAGAGVL